MSPGPEALELIPAPDPGDIVVAYPVPADTAPGDTYEVRAIGRMGFGDSQQVTIVAAG